jgi:hypothetical protein
MKNEIDEVHKFILENNLQDKLLKIDNCDKQIHKVKLAFINTIESRRNQKDFQFEYIENKYYYIFITLEENPNFGIVRENSVASMRRNTVIDNSKKQFEYLNFDYNKFIVTLNICVESDPTDPNSQIELFCKVPLQRETTSISHSTQDNILYYKGADTSDNSTMLLESFASLSDKYFIIEIENKKSEHEISIKDDGVVNVVYIVNQTKEELIELYTIIKYSIYYIKESLINYLSKYVYDIIFDFTHLPNENLLKFLENFGIITTKNDTQKLIFPLKQKIKSFRGLSYENKITYLNRQVPNIKKGAKNYNIPFYRFVKLLNKYDHYYNDKELKIKQSYLRKDKKYNYLNSSCIIDEQNDMISKEHKLNLHKTLTDMFEKINENLNEYTKLNNNESIDKFFLSSLNKYILQYTTYKGFFNIDIVLNEDSMVDLHCCTTKKYKKACNNFTFKFLSKFLNCFNLFFDCNEGFFHKHFNILDNSYNFNEKNIIYTFPSCFDSSKKNKIRIFDIPMLEKWTCEIGYMILQIWKDNHGLGMINKKERDRILNDNNFKEKSKEKILNFFKITIDNISSDLFSLYEEAFPNFYLFCNRISKFPLNKYNCIDNLCQHFTNSSLQVLLQNNLIFFHPFDIVYGEGNDLSNGKGPLGLGGVIENQNNNENQIDSDNFSNLTLPNLKVVIEPYMIYIDKNLMKYIDVKEKKEKFLNKMKMDLDRYLEELKMVNSEKIHYNLILGFEKQGMSGLNNNINIQKTKLNLESLIKNNSDKINIGELQEEIVETESTLKYNHDLTLVESHTFFTLPDKYHYDFSFLLNLSYFFIYKLTQDVRDKIQNFNLLKRYLISLETSQTMSFDGHEVSLLKNTPRNKAQIKAQCKKTKAILLKNFEQMFKVKSYSENMLLIFYNYMKSVVLNIKSQKIKNNNEINIREVSNFADTPNTFFKIGYFLINFKSMESDNSVDQFFRSEYYYNFSNYE